MSSTFERWALAVILGTFATLALAFSVVIPLGEAPDEVPHWAYVQYLVQNQHLPPPKGAVSGESHQPLLYYLMGALATFWIPQPEFTLIANPDFALGEPQTPNLLLHTRREAFPYQGTALAWHWFRLFSVAMGAVTVWSTWRIAAELIPHQTGIALGAAAFVAFLPAFTSLSAVVNNDNFIIMLSSLGVLQVLRLARQPLRWRDAGWLGVLLGLAPLAKLSGLVVWLFAAAVFLFVAWQSRQWKKIALYGALCFGFAGLCLAPWAIYNLLNYGDPLGWSLVLSTTPLRRAPMTWDDLTRVIGWGLYTSFWGRFGGGIHLRMADAIYVILGGLALLPLLGWARYARTPRHARRDFDARAILAAFGVFWLLMLAAFARWTLAVLGTDQARQLFPGLPLFAIVFTVGLAYLSVDHKEIVLTTAYGGLFGLTLAVLVYLGTTFAGSPQNLATLPRLGGAAAPADFGNTIRVVDYRVEPTRVTPGGTVDVHIQWQALSAPTENYWLLLQLAGSGEEVVNKDGVPSAGRPTTDWWRTGDVFVSHHTLTIPEDAASGTYQLRLGLHPFGKWEWLPVRGQEMLVLDSVIVTTQ